mmetsp:Transcript_59422/g.66505  ORF Transcript_59422/g.66505 Transcript_59422/m.66505 type:complete len:111 (+) Transcript_59422:357-689(+)
MNSRKTKITKGISGRLLFAIKQRRLIAHYYDFMSNNELNWNVSSRELNIISNIAWQWKVQSVQSIIRCVFVERNMNYTDTRTLSPDGETLDNMIEPIKKSSEIMREFISF